MSISQITAENIHKFELAVLRAALERAEQELSYCHAAMGTNRYFARDDALKQIRRALEWASNDEG